MALCFLELLIGGCGQQELISPGLCAETAQSGTQVVGARLGPRAPGSPAVPLPSPGCFQVLCVSVFGGRYESQSQSSLNENVTGGHQNGFSAGLTVIGQGSGVWNQRKRDPFSGLRDLGVNK